MPSVSSMHHFLNYTTCSMDTHHFLGLHHFLQWTGIISSSMHPLGKWTCITSLDMPRDACRVLTTGAAHLASDAHAISHHVTEDLKCAACEAQKDLWRIIEQVFM